MKNMQKVHSLRRNQEKLDATNCKGNLPHFSHFSSMLIEHFTSSYYLLTP